LNWLAFAYRLADAHRDEIAGRGRHLTRRRPSNLMGVNSGVTTLVRCVFTLFHLQASAEDWANPWHPECDDLPRAVQSEQIVPFRSAHKHVNEF
jgi:hypothetical protein